MPYSENENLREKLDNLAQRLGLPPLSDNNSETFHHLPLGKKKDKVPVTLIRFHALATKDAWLAKRGSLKDIGDNIRFFPNLTALNKKLLWLAKEKAREANYRFVWSSKGRIFARKEPNARAIRIASEDDVAKIS